MSAAKGHAPKRTAIKVEQVTEMLGVGMMIALGLVMLVGLLTASGHVTW